MAINSTEVTLNELLALRREFNTILSCGSEGSQHWARISTPTGDFTAYASSAEDLATLEALEPFCNKPVAAEEFRFTTHNFCNPASWDGRTNGDPAASWAAANGGVSYDDVGYRWLDAEGEPVCYLDAVEGGIGSVWRDSSDASIIVEFNPTTQHWERTDTNANVTSSRWSIIPYPNTKMEIAMANVIWGQDAVIQPTGTLRYTVHMYLPAGVAAPGAPAGVYPVKQFVYPSAYLMRLSADDHKDIGDDVFATYNYKTTVKPVLDSMAMMRLELALDNNTPVVSAGGRPGMGVFIGRKLASF